MKRVEKVIQEIKDNIEDLTDFEQDAWAEVELDIEPYRDKLIAFYHDHKQEKFYKPFFKDYEDNPAHNKEQYDMLVKDLQCMLADLLVYDNKEKAREVIKDVYYK